MPIFTASTPASINGPSAIARRDVAGDELHVRYSRLISRTASHTFLL